jgi:hypothetical protein
MATPKKILQTRGTGNKLITTTVKTVVQEITLFNYDSSSIVFTIYRTPSSDADKYKTENRIRTNVTVSAGNSVTFSNLKWVLDAGDTVSFSPSDQSRGYAVYIDGVEFE